MDKAYDPTQPAELVIAEATPADLEALAGILGSKVLEHHQRRPRARPAFTRIARAAGDIVGWSLVSHTRIRIGPAIVEAGVIDGLTSHNSSGDVPTRLLGDTLQVLGENSMPLALLHGARDTLQPFGFAPYRLVVHTTQQHNSDHEQQLRTLGDDDIETLDGLYRATYHTLPLHVIRAAPDWRSLLSEGEILGLDDQRGRLVAYARIVGQDVQEAASADSSAARALLRALPTATLVLPIMHPVTLAAIQLGATATIAAPTDDIVQLAGVVDLPLMLEQLVPAFEQRLAGSRYAGWSGNIRIEIETERVTLAFADGRPLMIDGSRPADLRLRRVTLCALAQCCLGYRTLSDLRATGELDFDDSALGLLEILFPAL